MKSFTQNRLRRGRFVGGVGAEQEDDDIDSKDVRIKKITNQ